MANSNLSTNKQDALNVLAVKCARTTFRELFAKDSAFRMAYQANIAMLIFDYGLTDTRECNEIADDIIRMIFEDR